ncbi:hypothetical protein SSX86_021057 [Deinandra increscens subsp. villosa]|uniref:E3 ubiquitin-protein ligase MARCHF6-like C-terminal domain-containing protein n=1 Tax=Deinandra increscens subsp. villosa TaxID=3103831 RepID=A0AAP0CVZ0_9ASTR
MVDEQPVLAADKGVGVAALNASSSSSSSSSSTVSPETASENANSDQNLSTSIYDDDDDDEGDVCRICRNPGDTDNPLRKQHLPTIARVCKHPFSFSPVYAENAPAKLPFQEFVVGISLKAYHALQFVLRLTFVLSVWLVIIPLITFWIWRFSFVRSFGEAQRLFLSHISTTFVLTDCLHGFLLSASIVFIFLGATSLRDYFHHLRDIGPPEGDRNGAHVARRPPNRNLVGENAGNIIRRNAEDVAARLEMQAARLEAHVEQIFDGLDGGDGAEDVPFDELVGMQGPLFHLVENAFTVLASNMIFIGVMILVPFLLGRFILHHLSWLLSSTTLSTAVPLTEQALFLANITLKNALTAVAGVRSDHNPDTTVVGHVSEILKANATGFIESSSNNIIQGETNGASWVTDVTTLAVGYIFIFTLVTIYFGTVTVIRYTKGEPLIMGRFYGIASFAETIPSLFKQFLTAMKHLVTMVKVAFLLAVELGVFPLMCGWWLDICTIRMFGKSITQRVDFFSASPLASSLIHWAVLRSGVLYFLRDPADPNYNPFRDLIDDPVHKHARRVLLSVAVYGSLIVMLVFLPVKLAMQMAPAVFPVDISISDPFTEIPANMLLFQICIPFAVEHFKLRATIKSLLHYWFAAVGWALGLTDFLLPRPEDNVEQENRNARSNLYAFIIGSYIISTMLAGARYSIDRIKTERATVLLGQIWKWCSIVVKSSFLLSIWIFAIPLLIGLLFELLVIVPMRVPVDESPVFLLYQDWAFGLIFLKIWTQLVMLDQLAPLVDDSWKVKFERVRDNGFSRLQGLWVLREIVIPIIMKLLTALCFPYVLARGVFPVFGYPLLVNSAVYRFAWIGCLGFSLVWFCGKRFHGWCNDLHNSIRDERYLIGRRLHNFGDNYSNE